MAEKTGPATIDEYIAAQPAEVGEILRRLRAIVHKEAPQVQERVSWQMPTFWYGENLVHFAAHKNHIGFYPSPDAIEHFAPRLAEYKTSKGGVQFPLAKPIPYELVEEMVRWRVEQVKS